MLRVLNWKFSLVQGHFSKIRRWIFARLNLEVAISILGRSYVISLSFLRHTEWKFLELLRRRPLSRYLVIRKASRSSSPPITSRCGKTLSDENSCADFGDYCDAKSSGGS